MLLPVFQHHQFSAPPHEDLTGITQLSRIKSVSREQNYQQCHITSGSFLKTCGSPGLVSPHTGCAFLFTLAGHSSHLELYKLQADPLLQARTLSRDFLLLQ